MVSIKSNMKIWATHCWNNLFLEITNFTKRNKSRNIHLQQKHNENLIPEHLQEILDGCVRFSGDVTLYIRFHYNGTCHNAKNKQTPSFIPEAINTTKFKRNKDVLWLGKVKYPAHRLAPKRFSLVWPRKSKVRGGGPSYVTTCTCVLAPRFSSNLANFNFT